jgi:hypothetical protein
LLLPLLLLLSASAVISTHASAAADETAPHVLCEGMQSHRAADCPALYLSEVVGKLSQVGALLGIPTAAAAGAAAAAAAAAAFLSHQQLKVSRRTCNSSSISCRDYSLHHLVHTESIGPTQTPPTDTSGTATAKQLP